MGNRGKKGKQMVTKRNIGKRENRGKQRKTGDNRGNRVTGGTGNSAK